MLEDGEEAGDGEEPDARGQVGQAELSPADEHRQLHVQAHLDGRCRGDLGEIYGRSRGDLGEF